MKLDNYVNFFLTPLYSLDCYTKIKQLPGNILLGSSYYPPGQYLSTVIWIFIVLYINVFVYSLELRWPHFYIHFRENLGWDYDTYQYSKRDIPGHEQPVRELSPHKTWSASASSTPGTEYQLQSKTLVGMPGPVSVVVWPSRSCTARAGGEATRPGPAGVWGRVGRRAAALCSLRRAEWSPHLYLLPQPHPTHPHPATYTPPPPYPLDGNMGADCLGQCIFFIYLGGNATSLTVLYLPTYHYPAVDSGGRGANSPFRGIFACQPKIPTELPFWGPCPPPPSRSHESAPATYTICLVSTYLLYIYK